MPTRNEQCLGRALHLLAPAVALALCLSIPAGAAAQTSVLGPTPAAVALHAPLSLTPGSLEPLAIGDARDHRWEGLAIGAAVAGIAGILMADALCTPDSGTDSCLGPVLGSGLVGAVVGGVLGGLIGSAIPKDSGDTGEG